MLAQEYELKEPIHIKRERVIRLNKYAIQRYCILCQNLYDEKIISNPSVFNYMDFFEYLYDNITGYDYMMCDNAFDKFNIISFFF